MEHKKSVILSLFDRVLLLSHLRFYLKNIEESVKILLNNVSCKVNILHD